MRFLFFITIFSLNSFASEKSIFLRDIIDHTKAFSSVTCSSVDQKTSILEKNFEVLGNGTEKFQVVSLTKYRNNDQLDWDIETTVDILRANTNIKILEQKNIYNTDARCDGNENLKLTSEMIFLKVNITKKDGSALFQKNSIEDAIHSQKAEILCKLEEVKNC